MPHQASMDNSGATDIESLLRTVELVTLPAVTLRIFQIIRDPQCSIEQLSQVVRTDPPLCVRVLRVVNSAQYGLPRQVNSLERAIALLGLSGLKRILIAANLTGLCPEGQITNTVYAQHIWQHSNAVACASRILAQRLGHETSNAYVAGLIHDLGIMLEMQVRREALASTIERVERDHVDFMAAEHQALGFNHTDLGRALCEQWDLPDDLVAVTAFHHDPMAAPVEHRPLAGIVHISDVLAARNGIGYSGTVGSHDLDPVALEYLNLDEEAVAEVEAELRNNLEHRG
ncbi:HDOD domain-containing protein [Planctomycetales bacterium ZRK34]|nr:HDOD domain-containing protein [Planctomycetales bacterium ZRK34]